MKKRNELAVGVLGSAALGLALIGAGTVAAEDHQRSRFVPEPTDISVVAGGSEPAEFLDIACQGWITAATPQHHFHYEASGIPLGVYVESDVDTTLVLQTPAGEYVCNDDFSTMTGRNPGLQFEAPETGNYSVWVGTYYSYEAGAAATLSLTESGRLWGSATGRAEGPDIVLRSGFLPDPNEVAVTAGGELPAFAFHPSCSGYVAGEAPDYSFEYHPGRAGLLLFAEGDVDTTLVVRSPSGDWSCNDDFSDETGRSAGVQFDDPEQGTYDVWVGTYWGNDSGAAAVLVITERTAVLADTPEAVGDGRQLTSTGTGFFASEEGHLLTNHHVVDGCSTLTIKKLGEAERDAVVTATSRETDLALLKVEAARPEQHGVFRSHPPLRLGEAVIVLGFPGDNGQGAILTTGVVSALSGFEGNLQEMEHTAEIRSGSSGSPILDSSGHVIGIVSGKLSTGSDEQTVNVNYAIRGSVARVFLNLNNVPHASAFSAERRDVPDVAESARHFTAVVNCYR